MLLKKTCALVGLCSLLSPLLVAAGSRNLDPKGANDWYTDPLSFSRSLQEEGGDGGGQLAHDSCEMPLLVQPQGPGDVVHLLEDTTGIDDSGRQRSICSAFVFGHAMYYTFMGTGNAFYVTTCDYPGLPLEGGVTTELDLTQDLNCTGTDEPVCVEKQYGNKNYCPDDTAGISHAFETEEGVEYVFSIVTKDLGKYNLRVGELPPLADAGGSTCEEPEVVVAPTIAEGEASASLILTKNNEGIYDVNLRYQEMCADENFSSKSDYGAGMWFAMEAPANAAQKFSISTCSEDTKVSSTVLGLMIQQEPGAFTDECTPEAVICFEFSKQISTPKSECQGTDLSEINFISKPGETYYIYLASEHSMEVGDIQLNITAESTTISGFEMAKAGRDRREKRRPGVSCRLEGQPWVDETEYGLNCQDSCLYCETEETMAGTPCFNRTDFLHYESGVDVPSLVGYKLDINYYQRDSMETWDIVTFEYEELAAGGCVASLNGLQCESCMQSDCGSPTVGCSNVITRGIIGTVWEAESLDLCEMKSTVFSFRPEDHNVNGECAAFLSETACAEGSKDLEEDGMECVCELDNKTGGSDLVCHSNCGVYCNDDLSICGVREAKDAFYASGDYRSASRGFEYIHGGDEYGNVEMYGSWFTSSASCTFRELFGDSCTNCQMKTCDGETSGSKFFHPFAMEVDCSDAEGGEVFDTCDPLLQIDDGPFQFLSANTFDECMDLAPANADCGNAIPLSFDSETGTVDVMGSTTYIAGESERSANCGEHPMSQPGLFYTIVGTGGWLRATTCFPETIVRSIPVLMDGTCRENNCTSGFLTLDLFQNCEGEGDQIEWESEDGKEYIVFVHGLTSTEPGDFKLQIEQIELIPPMERCDEYLATSLGGLSGYNCSCSEAGLFGVTLMGVLDCEPMCKRCDSAEDPTYCLNDFHSLAFNPYGEHGSALALNVSSDGFNGALISKINYGSDCEVAIGHREDLRAGVDPTDCSCELAICADGSEAPVVDCGNFSQGLQINLCEETEVTSDNVLSLLIPDQFGECHDGGVTAVERSGEDSGDLKGSDIDEGTPSDVDEGTPTSAASIASFVWCFSATGLVLALSLGEVWRQRTQD